MTDDEKRAMQVLFALAALGILVVVIMPDVTPLLLELLLALP